MKKRKTKAPKNFAPAAPARPPLTRYAPELAEWLDAGWNGASVDKTGSAFPIYENNGEAESPKAGRLVATIHVDPSYSPECAAAIATLMSYAPHLWRTLQKYGPYVEEDIEGVKHLARITEAMWNAAGRNPFAPRDVFQADEDLTYSVMRKEIAGEYVPPPPALRR